MRPIIFSILIFTTFNIIGQSIDSRNRISLYFNPVNVRIGDLNNQRILTNHDRIDINYTRFITQEIGFNFNHKFKNKIVSIQSGLQLKDIKYGYLLNIDADISSNSKANYRIRTENRSIRLFGGNLGISFQVLKSTSISLSLEMNFIAKGNSDIGTLRKNNSYSVSKFSSSQLISQTKLNITENINNLGNESDYYIPQINFQTNITKNISINYGLKYKFWGRENFIDIQVKGYYDTPSDPETILFESKVKNTQMLTYFGLAYTFGLGKKKIQE